MVLNGDMSAIDTTITPTAPHCAACGETVTGSRVGTHHAAPFVGYCVTRGCPEDRRVWTWRNGEGYSRTVYLCGDCIPAGATVEQLDDMRGHCQACGERDGNLRRVTLNPAVSQRGWWVTATGAERRISRQPPDKSQKADWYSRPIALH